MKQAKKILLVLGHAFPNTYCEALMRAYQESAVLGGAEVRVLSLKDMDFDPVLRSMDQALEPDLVRSREAIQWCDHMTFVYPTWWANLPALLKGFFDRVFLTGFAYAYKKGSPFPEQLLRGRTARLILTMDAPSWWNRWMALEPQNHSVRFSTLMFSGIRPVRVNSLCEIRTSTPVLREKWLKKVRGFARVDLAGARV